MKRNLLLFFAFSFAIHIYGQTNPRPGYIVTNLNDTIYGTIDYLLGTQNATKCKFQENGESKYTTYLPGEIYAYRLTDDGRFYVTRSVDIGAGEQTYFLEYLLQGIVSLYYLSLPLDTETYYFFEDELGELILMTASTHSSSIDAAEKRHEKNRRIKEIFPVFEKSKKTQVRLTEIDLKKDDLTKLVKDYHLEVCNTQEGCMQFEYKQGEDFITRWFVGGGMSFFTLSFDAMKKKWGVKEFSAAAPSVHVGTDIYIPRFSNRFYLQALLCLSYLNMEENASILGTLYPSDIMQIKMLATDLQLGGAYRFTNSSRLVPVLHMGFCVTYSFIDAEYRADNEYKEDISDFIHDFYLGGYGGLSLEYKCAKGTPYLGTLYKYRKHKYKKDEDMKLNSIELKVGYKF